MVYLCIHWFAVQYVSNKERSDLGDVNTKVLRWFYYMKIAQT